MNEEYILIITEGEKTEIQFLENIKKVFLNRSDKKIIFLSFCANIHELYNELREEKDMLDTVEVLKEIYKKSSKKLKEINASSLKYLEELDYDEISEIYLFFDYDPHDNRRSDKNVLEMLELFNEETENGKLYISYPMIEAVKHCNLNKIEECIFVDLEKLNNYKNLVNRSTDFCDMTKLNYLDWVILLSFNLLKTSILLKREKILSKKEFTKIVTQVNIFTEESKKLKEEEKLVVLGSLEIFLLDYFKSNLFDKIVQSRDYKEFSHRLNIE